MKILPIAASLLLAAAAPAPAGGGLSVPGFSHGTINHWQQEIFSGKTRYSIVSHGQNQVLEAISQGTASGLYFQNKQAISSTSTLNWRWKVSSIAPAIDERSKQGDDYPARIYIVVSNGPFFWQKRTLVYVWSNNQPVGTRWDNAYTEKARMWALNSGNQGINQWQSHSRNLQQDLLTAFGKTYNQIDAIAVMTDSDNSGNRFHSWYDDVILK